MARKHSPTPWEESDEGDSIFAADGHEVVADDFTDDRWKADRPFIILACNNHDALVEALREILNVPLGFGGEVHTIAQRALAKIDGAK